jgi:hypothetical protein
MTVEIYSTRYAQCFFLPNTASDVIRKWIGRILGIKILAWTYQMKFRRLPEVVNVQLVDVKTWVLYPALPT